MAASGSFTSLPHEMEAVMSESSSPNQRSHNLVLLGRNPAGFSVLPDKNLLLWEQMSAW